MVRAKEDEEEVAPERASELEEVKRDSKAARSSCEMNDFSGKRRKML